MLRLRGILSAIAAMCVCAAAFTVELPADESGLIALLEECVIDTFQYEQLLVFYALPLSVPQGELAYLIRAFPDIEDLLPDSNALSLYKPFDNRHVQRLFGDFPTLALFEPILRFNTVSAERTANKASGEVILGINKSPINELRGQRVRFRQKSKYVSTEGAVTLSDTGAMWQNRRIELSYRDVTAHIGNYRQPIPGELIYGRFLSPPSSDSTATESTINNWLYANSGTWNGAAVNIKNIPGVPMLGASMFGHARLGEKIGGGGIDFYHGRQLRVFAGVTGVLLETESEAGGGADTGYLYTAHLYGEYKNKVWRAVTEAGLPLNDNNENIIPAAAFRLNYRIKNSSAEYHLTNYPEDFAAPLSRTKRQALNEIGERDPTRSPSIRKHSLRMAVPFFETAPIPLVTMMRLTPEINFTESGGGVKRIHGQAELRTRNGWGDVSVKHSSRIFTAEPDSILHTSGASVYLRTRYPLDARVSYQRVYGYGSSERNTYVYEMICTAIPSAVIAPFVHGRYATEHTCRLGVKTELHLYKKTWTSVTVEIPVGVKGDHDVYVKASSSYAF